MIYFVVPCKINISSITKLRIIEKRRKKIVFYHNVLQYRGNLFNFSGKVKLDIQIL